MKKFNVKTSPLDLPFDYIPGETQALKAKTYEDVTLDELRRFALWKLNRVLEIPEPLILELRHLATRPGLSHRDPASLRVLRALVGCRGVWYPMASAFLKFVRPAVFPIIDVRAYRALRGKVLKNRSDYTVELYLEYADALHAIAFSRDVPLALVDEQLYAFDKKYNGVIRSNVE